MSTQVLIRIEAGEGAAGYTASLFAIEAGGPVVPALATGPFDAPADLLALKEVLPGNTPPSAIDQKGLALYQALHQALRKPLRDVLAGPRTVIHFELGDNALRALPWEILVWSDVQQGVQLTRVRANHDISRVWKMAWDAPDLLGHEPLRLLVAIGAGKGISAAEEVIEIRRRIQPNERPVDILEVNPPTKDDLYHAIKTFRPHVLHFVGHGDSECLHFEGWEWKAIDFGDIGGISLKDWKPCLVFLNACRSAVAGASVTLGDLAPHCATFLTRGAQAVIAMQGDIQGIAAGTLAGAFYEKLAAGCPIHEAVSEARAAVEAPFGGKEASYPALMLRCSSRAALPCFRALTTDYRERSKLCEMLPRLRVFVNQTATRREIYGRLWPYQEGQLRQPFILLRGPSSHGKTVLAAALLDLATRLGHRVRYVDLGLDPPVDFITILQRIWGGPSNGPPQSPLLDPLPLDPDVWRKKFEAANQAKDVEIYTEFRQALAGIGNDRPLTIVLDNFRPKNVSDSVFWYVWEHLFLHVGRDLKNANILLVLDDDNYSSYQIDKQLQRRSHFRAHTVVELAPLTADDFTRWWKEYMYFRSEALKELLDEPDMDATIRIAMRQEKPRLSVSDFEKKTQDLAGYLKIRLTDILQQ